MRMRLTSDGRFPSPPPLTAPHQEANQPESAVECAQIKKEPLEIKPLPIDGNLDDNFLKRMQRRQYLKNSSVSRGEVVLEKIKEERLEAGEEGNPSEGNIDDVERDQDMNPTTNPPPSPLERVSDANDPSLTENRQCDLDSNMPALSDDPSKEPNMEHQENVADGEEDREEAVSRKTKEIRRRGRRLLSREIFHAVMPVTYRGRFKFRCFCYQKFFTASRLNWHVAYYTRTNFKCGVCGHTFAFYSLLNQHLIQRHGYPNETGKGEVGCSSCGKIFKSKRECRKHNFRRHLQK